MTQGERQNYNWRPNDYSTTTRLRYDMEVGHWIDSIKGVTSKTSTTLSEELGVIGLFIGLIVNLGIIIVLLLTYLFKWLLGLTKSEPIVEPRRTSPLSYSELIELEENGGLEEIDIYED